MSDNLKIQKFKITTIEKICQKLKVCYFCDIICERQLENVSGRFLCIVNAKTVKPLVLLRTQPKFFQKIILEIFLVYGKIPIIQFSYMEKYYHRDFIHISVRMELYDKKFLIYGNCMIRSFGHPGDRTQLITRDHYYYTSFQST